MKKMTLDELKQFGFKFDVQRKGYTLWLNGTIIAKEYRMTHDPKYPAMIARQELKFWLDKAEQKALEYVALYYNDR